ncbi:MAG TPA: hypothetical protein VMW48_02330, partial [Vicinamibacterales bacterium]|nr:hypothetical protein [Vicinamibacterales bacterium]
VYALVVQNAAPRAQLGAATATSQFFRSIGSTIGVALFGTMLLGVYHQQLELTLPAGTSADVRKLVDNPLTSNAEPGTMSRGVPMQAVEPAVAASVRASLAAGMQRVFEVASVVMGLSILLNLLLPELPLRTRAEHAVPIESA